VRCHRPHPDALAGKRNVSEERARPGLEQPVRQ